MESKLARTNFSINLRQIRNDRNMSITEMADFLDENRTTYANWENDREPKYAALKKISQKLNVEIDFLFRPPSSSNSSFDDACIFLNNYGLTASETPNDKDYVTITSSKEPSKYKPLRYKKSDMIGKVEYIIRTSENERAEMRKRLTKSYFHLESE